MTVKGEEKHDTQASALRGAARLVLEATDGIAGVVESMQREIGSGPAVLGRPLAAPAKAITRLVHGGFRGVTRVVGLGIDAALAQLEPLLSAAPSGREYDSAVAVLNGVLGDHLKEAGNPLAIEMRFRRDGKPLPLDREGLRAALPRASPKLLVLVHGSCVSDWQWTRLGHDHGAALERDLGYTPVYLHYNTGLHVSENGHALDALLDELVAAWPVPVEELVLLAHSLGGLVARSACLSADERGAAWRDRLQALVCLGSPHQGTVLERGGNWVDNLLEVSRYSRPLAQLGKIRSPGVTDMRFGYVADAQWQGRERFALAGSPEFQPRLPEGVRCYAIAGTRAEAPGESLPGDGLVSVDSALGRHERPELALDFPASHTWVGYGLSHIDLLSDPEVYAHLKEWLEADARPPQGR